MLRRPPWTSRENRTIAALVLAAALLTAWHHAAGGAPAPERLVRRALAPLQSGVSATCAKTRGAWRSVAAAGELARKLEGVERERDALANDKLKLLEAARMNKLLREQLGFELGTVLPDMPATVIAHSGPTSQPRTITIKVSRGRELREGDVVCAAKGLVGRITSTDGTIGEVTLLLDRSSGAAAVLQRSRDRGMVRPPDELDPGSDNLRLVYLPKGADVRVGDVVLTSGEGEVYPPGLPLGKVLSVEPSLASDVSRTAVVEPFADFDHLEYVLVVRR